MKKPEIQRTFHKNGQPYQEVPFVGDTIHGVIREWHKNGVLAREVPMRDGLRHGVCKQWNENGKLLGTFEMKCGSGTSKQWFPNGQLEYEASIVNEKFSGRFRHWNQRGKLVEETYFVKNKKVSKLAYERVRQIDQELPSYSEETEKHSEPIKSERRSRHKS